MTKEEKISLQGGIADRPRPQKSVVLGNGTSYCLERERERERHTHTHTQRGRERHTHTHTHTLSCAHGNRVDEGMVPGKARGWADKNKQPCPV